MFIHLKNTIITNIDYQQKKNRIITNVDYQQIENLRKFR